MDDTIKLFQLAVGKVAEDKDFFAYYITHYKGDDELRDFLNIEELNYYKLAMCRMPDPEKKTFDERVKAISSYTTIAGSRLKKFITKIRDES